MRAASYVVSIMLLALLTACGGDDEPAGSPPAASTPASEPASETASASGSQTPTDATGGEILGEPGLFVAGGSGAEDLTVMVQGRECVLAEALPLSCRASTGAGGGFVVTAEGVDDAPGDWNIVVRCGLDPARPAISASGDFLPVTADLGLTPYGELVGLTLRTDERVEAALAYWPEGAECPVVWGIGEIGQDSIFTGGTDALNGEEAPILFTDATGQPACAVADEAGGIRVGSPQGTTCA